MFQCLEEIGKGNISISEASRKYDIPRSTIYNKRNDLHLRNCGHPTVFNEAEEKAFANHMIVLADWGFPVGTADFRSVVKSYLDAQKRRVDCFKENMPLFTLHKISNWQGPL